MFANFFQFTKRSLMKRNATTMAIFFALTSVCSTSVIAEEYKTKSVFSADFKCVSEEKGGFNHNASGHNLTLFKGEEEFFLTHISNIPDEAILDLNKMMKAETNDVKKLRAIFENRVLKQETIAETMITEESSYFIRKPEDDPKSWINYFWNGCSRYKSQQGTSSVNCYKSDSSKTFTLDLDTMRFTYSYAGSWHNKSKNGYYGDSSVFAFGTCKKYYR